MRVPTAGTTDSWFLKTLQCRNSRLRYTCPCPRTRAFASYLRHREDFTRSTLRRGRFSTSLCHDRHRQEESHRTPSSRWVQTHCCSSDAAPVGQARCWLTHTHTHTHTNTHTHTHTHTHAHTHTHTHTLSLSLSHAYLQRGCSPVLAYTHKHATRYCVLCRCVLHSCPRETSTTCFFCLTGTGSLLTSMVTLCTTALCRGARNRRPSRWLPPSRFLGGVSAALRFAQGGRGR
jgi:hypothetical protein